MPIVLIVDDNAELANLLAVVAEASGIETCLAYSGREALALLEEHHPDAALVDLLLPDMRGHDVLLQLSALGIPCFAMSGVFRGEGLIREATDVYGARGFFEKPFVARELMERLSELLTSAGPAALPARTEALEELRLDEAEGPGEGDVPALEEMTSAETTGFFAVRPEVPPGPVLAATRPIGFSSGSLPDSRADGETFVDAAMPCVSAKGSPEQAFGPLSSLSETGAPATGGAGDAAGQRPIGLVSRVESLQAPVVQSAAPLAPQVELAAVSMPASASGLAASDARLPFSGRDVWRPLGRSAASDASEAAAFEKAGSLARTSIPRLLTALFLGQQTGELRIKRKDIVKVIGIHGGQLVSAASNLGSEHFARFAVRAGRLQEDKLAFVQDEARRMGMRAGEAMVALGLIREQEHRQLVERQVKQIIWSTFDWKDGEHQFLPRASPRSDLVKVSLSPGPLILEGIRSTFSLVRLRELVPPVLRFFPTADPPYQLQDLALGDREALLLAHADGSKTVEDLVVLSDLSERDALALLHGLAQTGILEPRESAPRRSRVVLV